MTSKTHVSVWVAMIVVGLIAIGAYWYPKMQSASNLGAAVDCGSTTCFTTVGILTSLQVDGTTQIGSSGTALSQLQKGTCTLIGATSGIVASTSIAVDCAVSGVVTGDTVFAQFATSSPSTGGFGWLVTRASASTTSGFITLNITNGTGATANLPASLGSSTKYLILR